VSIISTPRKLRGHSGQAALHLV